jgi:S1-C subfamily serine protease
MNYKIFIAFLIILPLGSNAAQTSNPATQAEAPLSLQLALVTARVEIFSGETRVGTATGFFCANAEESRLFFVTNRHVARKEDVQFFPDYFLLKLHANRDDLRQFADFRIDLYRDKRKQQPVWRELSPAVDVIAIEVSQTEIRARYVYKSFRRDDFITEDVIVGLGDPLVIIGYPLGFYDELYNLPVARQGAVASVFPVPFRGQRYFLVDANLHPGMSGSPVITKPSPFMLLKGPSHGSSRNFYLVGVNSGSVDPLGLNAAWLTNVIADLLR